MLPCFASALLKLTRVTILRDRHPRVESFSVSEREPSLPIVETETEMLARVNAKLFTFPKTNKQKKPSITSKSGNF